MDERKISAFLQRTKIKIKSDERLSDPRLRSVMVMSMGFSPVNRACLVTSSKVFFPRLVLENNSLEFYLFPNKSPRSELQQSITIDLKEKQIFELLNMWITLRSLRGSERTFFSRPLSIIFTAYRIEHRGVLFRRSTSTLKNKFCTPYSSKRRQWYSKVKTFSTLWWKGVHDTLNPWSSQQ